MKKTTTLVATMLLAAASYAGTGESGYFATVAGNSPASTDRAARAYLACLATANDGVLESALAHIAMIKLDVPTADNSLLEAKVAEVARTAASPEIRYKAFLTGMVLTHVDMFRKVERNGYDSPDELFGVLASRLSEYYAER